MPKTNYSCQSCAAKFPKWSGKCNVCGEWNTLIEELDNSISTKSKSTKKLNITKFDSIPNTKTSARLIVASTEINNLLGGGLVPGSITLIAGQPGIGKSTFLLQFSQQISKKAATLYVSGEESEHQIQERAKRLNISSSDLDLSTSNSAESIAQTIESGVYKVVIVDSIQTISLENLSSPQGSVSQITQTAQLLSRIAKSKNVCLIIVGHVTKEGNIAGPKILEHLVDTVLNLEGDRYGDIRVLRSIKNRFGATNEIVLFDMKDKGLEIIDSPSKSLLKERQLTDGSIVLATVEGSRPLLVEVQALVHSTAFGYPKRTSSGFDINKLNLLIAMLDRRTKLNLSDKDIFINIVGGLKLNDPGADLAICLAIASAAKSMLPIDDFVVFGEVGLSGEIRTVSNIEKRISEANSVGFNKTVGPKFNTNSKDHLSVSNIKDTLNKLLKEKK